MGLIMKMQEQVYIKLLRECWFYMRKCKPSYGLWLQNAYAIHYYIREIKKLRGAV
jgi:hypothetical protein